MSSDNCSIDMESKRVKTGHRKNVGLMATWGAVISAVLSSACCWLPLFLIAFGASAAGVSGFFEAYRFYLLGATGLLLAVGFYLIYFHKDKCESGSACATVSPGLGRFNKIILWTATVFVFLFALFPNYLGLLIGGGGDTGAAVIVASEDRLYRIEGMTCEGCASHLRSHLRKIPGVIRADVSYEAGTAHIFFNNEMALPPYDKILEAIKKMGYQGFQVADEDKRTVQIDITGMTCPACTSGLAVSLRSLPGIANVGIDYNNSRAIVTLLPEGEINKVIDTIADQGFKGKVKEGE